MVYQEDIVSFKDKIQNITGSLLAIDYGTKKTGLAFSNKNCSIAFTLATVLTTDMESYIDKYLSINSVKAVVIGWPKTLKNSVHLMGEDILKYAKKLSDKSLPVLLWDERMSTVGAVKAVKQHYNNNGRKKNFQIDNDDDYAAQYILQQVLDIINNY